MLIYKELNDKSKQLEGKTHLQRLEIYQRFMFERILERISVSKYNQNFILKGGLLLSAIFGIDNRSTRDMDVSIKGIDVSKEKMIEILNEILAINIQDGVKFDIIDITNIREDDKYGGNKYHIVGKIENLKINLEIDISTGDKVTPKELKYTYSSIFEDKKIIIYSYNIETILAEKLETLLRRGKYNTRMKDYYDIHTFMTKLKNELDVEIFKLAFNNVITKRDSLEYLKDYKQILEDILNDSRISSYWENYKSKNKYVGNIKFSDIITEVQVFIKNCNIV